MKYTSTKLPHKSITGFGVFHIAIKNPTKKIKQHFELLDSQGYGPKQEGEWVLFPVPNPDLQGHAKNIPNQLGALWLGEDAVSFSCCA